MMKIQNRSVLNTGIWKISDMSQVQETQKAKASQTESIVRLPTEAQRNQQRNEFKSQEHLMQANLQQRLSMNPMHGPLLGTLKLDKQMNAEFPNNPDGDTARSEIIRLQMESLKRLIDAHLSSPGVLGPRAVEHDLYRAALIRQYENELDNLQTQFEKLRQSQQIFENELANIENGQFPSNHSEFGSRVVVTQNGEGAPSVPESHQSERVQQQTTAINPSINGNHGTQWRRASSNGVPNNNQNSGAGTPNQKGDGGQESVDYSGSSNSSHDSHTSAADNRDYSPKSTEPKEPDDTTGSGFENDTHDQQNNIDIVSPEGYAPGEYSTLPGDDPMTGHGGKSGNDIGASGRIPKGSPDNRSGIEKMVQPGINLFSTTTGADDEEHPNTGNAQGTVWNPTEGNDLGDDLPYDLGGGGSIDIEAGKVLLEQIRPINPGGPDPTKIR